MKIEGNGDYTLIDLFCGGGGAGLGFKEAGFSIDLGVDIDEMSLGTYHENLGARTLGYDLFEDNAGKIMEASGLKAGEVTVLLGCPPCQGFSTLGNNPVNDVRNQLVSRFVDVVKYVKPLFIAFENVPGLAEHDQYFGKAMRRLRRAGYIMKPHIVDMRNYGVPQRRVRLVTVGCRSADMMRSYHFPLETAGKDLSDRIYRRWTTVRDAIGDLPPLAAGEKSETIANHVAGGHNPELMEKISNIPHDGGSRRQLPERLWYACHKNDKSKGFNDILGRMKWDEPSPTITTGCCNPTKGRFLHPEQDRAITIREAARLQTFPDSFIFPESKMHATRQIGNALPPAFARKLGTSIITVLKEHNL